MDSSERRNQIMCILKSETLPVNASKLADKFDVTRQIIVSDIAILRAMGNPIISEKRGYYIERPHNDMFYTVVCKHSEEQTINEFYAVVDNGGKILDVSVEHPIYGQISANLNIGSRYDAEEFVRCAKECNASQLCELTSGYHMHTLAMPDEKAYERTVAKLDELGILIKNND